MWLFDLFAPKKSREDQKRSHLKNLMAVAMVDGHLDDAEARVLIHIAGRLGIEESEVRAIIANHDMIGFHLPKLHKDRVVILWDFICLILADGKIEEQEMILCERFARKLRIRPSFATTLVRKLCEWGVAEDTTIESLKQDVLILVGDKRSFEDA